MSHSKLLSEQRRRDGFSAPLTFVEDRYGSVSRNHRLLVALIWLRRDEPVQVARSRCRATQHRGALVAARTATSLAKADTAGNHAAHLGFRGRGAGRHASLTGFCGTGA